MHLVFSYNFDNNENNLTIFVKEITKTTLNFKSFFVLNYAPNLLNVMTNSSTFDLQKF